MICLPPSKARKEQVCLTSACLVPRTFCPHGIDFAFHYFAISQLDAIKKART